MDTITYNKLSESNAIVMTTTPASNLAYWVEAYDMSFPVSGDMLAIFKEAKKINEPELAVTIFNERNA